MSERVKEVSHVSFEGVDLRGVPFRSEKLPIRPAKKRTKPPEVIFTPATTVLVQRAVLLNPFGGPEWIEDFKPPARVPQTKSLRLEIPDILLMRFHGKVTIPFV